MFPPFPQVCDRDRYRAGDTLTWGLVCWSTSSHREAAFLPEVQPLGPPPHGCSSRPQTDLPQPQSQASLLTQRHLGRGQRRPIPLHRKAFTHTPCLASHHPASCPRVAHLHPTPSRVLLCRLKGSSQSPCVCRPPLRLYKVLLTQDVWQRLGISQNSAFPDTSTFRAQFFYLQNWG